MYPCHLLVFMSMRRFLTSSWIKGARLLVPISWFFSETHIGSNTWRHRGKFSFCVKTSVGYRLVEHNEHTRPQTHTNRRPSIWHFGSVKLMQIVSQKFAGRNRNTPCNRWLIISRRSTRILTTSFEFCSSVLLASVAE